MLNFIKNLVGWYSPRFDLGGGDVQASPPPQYSPMLEATKYAVQSGERLGNMQIDEARRQYDLNRQMQLPVSQAEIEMMQELTRQGKDYYDYMVQRQRPVEEALNAEAMLNRLPEWEAQRKLITGPEQDIYNLRQADIENTVNRAIADARQGTTAEYNRLIRQGLRYGYAPEAITARLGPTASVAGLGAASMANIARQQGIAQARGLLEAERNMRMQDEATQWAKRLDVAGLYRGLPGASQGAYGLATGAGNAAIANQMQPGGQLLAGLQAGAGTTQQGISQQLGGLSSILGSQTGAYNTWQSGEQQKSAAGTGATGMAIGAIGGIAAAAII